MDTRKYDPTKKRHETRDGRYTAELLCDDIPGSFPLYFKLTRKANQTQRRVICTTNDGRYFNNAEGDNLDIISLPETRKVWVAILGYEDGEFLCGQYVSETRVEAEQFYPGAMSYKEVEIELP